MDGRLRSASPFRRPRTAYGHSRPRDAGCELLLDLNVAEAAADHQPDAGRLPVQGQGSHRPADRVDRRRAQVHRHIQRLDHGGGRGGEHQGWWGWDVKPAAGRVSSVHAGRLPDRRARHPVGGESVPASRRRPGDRPHHPAGCMSLDAIKDEKRRATAVERTAGGRSGSSPRRSRRSGSRRCWHSRSARARMRSGRAHQPGRAEPGQVLRMVLGEGECSS